MTPLVWMIAVSAGSWVLVTALAPAVNPEAAFGMAGPLTSACATWVATVRAQLVSPERVTRVLVTGLWMKLVFFGVYVIALLQGLALRPEPFVVSFAGYFIGLHAMEAFFLHRLLSHGPRAAPHA